jgi:hypothetical protein
MMKITTQSGGRRNSIDQKLTVLLPADDTPTLEANNLKITSAIKLRLESSDNQPPQILEVKHGDSYRFPTVRTWNPPEASCGSRIILFYALRFFNSSRSA